MGKRLLLILNPRSGKMTGKRHLANVVESFCRADYEPLVYVTTGPGHATRLAKQHGGEVDLVVCLGGDGTFNEVVSGLLSAGHKTQIGYIPCGSTNDFANSIGLKKTIPAATAAILNGEPHTYDVGRFDQRYFSYIASFGAFTHASYATPQDVKNALGHMAYVLEGLKEISKIRPWKVRVETEGMVLEDEYIFGAVSNSTSLGGLLTLDPHRVDMNDGLLELLLVKMPRTPVELSDTIRALLEQKYDVPGIVLHSASRFSFFTEEGMQWTLDGEFGGSGSQIEIRNLKDAVCILH